jgi:predicted extracellular nuclease
MLTLRVALFRACFLLFAFCASSLASVVSAAAFTNGNLAVYRVGDGSAALSAVGTAVFIDEYTPTGTLVQTIAMPTTAAGAQKQLVASGSATTEGLMSLSADGQCLWVPGYAANLATAGVATTTSASTPRTIGRIMNNGVVDTSTSLSDFFSGGNIRSATGATCSAAWVSGSNSGVGYATFGTSTLTSVISTTATNLRQVNVANGQLYVSTGAGSGGRVATVGTGLPTTSGQTITGLPGIPTSGTTNAFFFADLSPAVAGVDTVYVTEEGAAALTKYSLVGGTWVSNGTIGVAADTYRGVTGVVTGTTVALYAVRKAGELVSLTDASGYNGSFTGTPTLIASSGTNKAFRGVALVPNGTPPTVPTVSISLSTNTASEAAATVVTITATTSSAVSGEQSVSIAVSGTGITAGDYVLSSPTITIPPGGTMGTATFTVVNDGVPEGPETATIALTGPSSGMTLGAPSSATVTIADSSPPPITRIHAVQGSGTASPLVGQTVTIEGIVTGSYQGATDLGGFFVQEEDVNADADPLTSEGVFVFHGTTPVVVGDKVRVTGTVTEFGTAPDTLTEITTATVSVLSSGNPLPAAVTVTLPVATLGDLERYEGMRVQVSQTLTVTEHFNLARYGELTLSVNGRLPQPTNFIDPNDATASGTSSSGASNVAAINAQNNLNARSSILLADTGSTQNPGVIPFIDPVNKTLRTGSTVASLSGILTHSFGTHAIHPTTAPVFNYAPRPATPPAVGGALKVASFNVLNFFNGDGAEGGFPTSRGANTFAEFNRQKAKTVAALCGLNADIVGLMEMENDATTAAPALNELTGALNGTSGCGSWSFVANPANWGSFPGSTDEIRPAIIYRNTAVAPVGVALSPNDAAFTQARAPVAQTFRITSGASTGAKLSVIVNHFKSKGAGGTGADADQNDGQGFYNAARKAQATALLSFITTVQTAANDPDVLVIGDLNAYTEEDPIDILRAGGLVNLDEAGYSYVFDGLTGSLDHALATPSLVAQITGTGVWHINADEPRILDYNVEFKSGAPGCIAITCTSPDYYAPTPFRSSDHDPVIVGMALVAAQLTLSPSPQSFGTSVAGGSTVDRTLTLSNGTAQSGSLTAIDVTGTGYTRSGGTCPTSFPATVAGNGSCTVIVRFTPTTPGTPAGSVAVSGDATASATLNATVVAVLATSPASVNGTVGTALSVTLTATGGSTPYTWALASGSNLPAGLSLAGNTVSGTPTAVGSGTTTFNVTDGSGQSATLVLSYNISAAPVATLSLNTSSQSFGSNLVAGSTSVDRTITLTSNAPVVTLGADLIKAIAPSNLSAITVTGTGFARNGGTCPTVFPATLASGTSCSIIVRFTPTAAGAATGDLTVTGDSTVSASLSATVVPTLSTSPRSVAAVTGTAVNLQLTASGTAPFTWSIASGTLPAGLTLSGNTISGTPTVAGNTFVTLQVIDATGQSATLTLSFAITAAVVIAEAVPVPGLGNGWLLLSLLLAICSGVRLRRQR